MAEYNLGTARGRIDIDDSGLASTQARASAAASAITRSFAQTSASLVKTGQSMSRLGSSMTRWLTLPLIGIGVYATKTASEFAKSLNSMQAVAGVTGGELEKLRALALQLGQDTIFSANEAAMAMLELSKAGVSVADIMGGTLEQTLSLAAAGDLELAEAATVASNAMNMFNLSGGQAQQVADALAGSANASSADVLDLAEAMKMGGSAAALVGVSIQEFTALLAALADQGIRGSDAGTSLKTFFVSLPGLTEKARAMMKKYNLEFFNSEGAMLSVAEIASRLSDKLGDLSQKEQLVALKTIFGTDALRAAAIVMKTGEKGIRDYIDATTEQGSAAEVAEAKMKGLPGAIEVLKGSVETAALAFGDALAPALMKVGEFLTKLFNAFTELPKGTQETIVAVAAAAAALGPLLFIVGKLTSGVGRLFQVLGVLGGGFQTFTVAANGATTAVGPTGFGRAISTLGTLLRGAGVAGAIIAIVTSIQNLADITMDLNRIGKGVSEGMAQAFKTDTIQVWGSQLGNINKALIDTTERTGQVFDNFWGKGGTFAGPIDVLNLLGEGIRHVLPWMQSGIEKGRELGEEFNEAAKIADQNLRVAVGNVLGLDLASAKGLNEAYALSLQQGGAAAGEAYIAIMQLAAANPQLAGSAGVLIQQYHRLTGSVQGANVQYALQLIAQGKVEEGMALLQAAVGRATDRFREHLKGIMTNKRAYKTWGEALVTSTDLTREQRTELGRMLNAITQQGVKLKGARADALKAALSAGDYSRALSLLRNAINRLPPRKQSKIDIPGLTSLTAGVRRLDSELNRLDGKVVTTTIKTIYQTGGRGGQARHGGGPITGAGEVMVRGLAGEYMLRRWAVKDLGHGFVSALNIYGKKALLMYQKAGIPAYHEGGTIQPTSPVMRMASGPTGPLLVRAELDGKVVAQNVELRSRDNRILLTGRRRG